MFNDQLITHENENVEFLHCWNSAVDTRNDKLISITFQDLKTITLWFSYHHGDLIRWFPIKDCAPIQFSLHVLKFNCSLDRFKSLVRSDEPKVYIVAQPLISNLYF